MIALIRRILEILTMPLRALLQAPGKLVSGAGRFSRLSLPARVALLAVIFLVLCVVFCVVAYLETKGRAALWALLTPGWVLGISVLVLVIPFVLYKALKLCLEGDVSPFPDILQAWEAGLAALAEHGLNLAQTPFFLVLGSATQSQEKALFHAARLELTVHDVPPGTPPIRWYAHPDGIYLVCSDASALSKLSRLSRSVLGEEQAQPEWASFPPQGGDYSRGTIIAGRGGGDVPSLSGSVQIPQSPLPTQTAPPEAIRGTVMAGGGTIMVGEYSSAGVVPRAEKKVIKLDQHAAAEQDRRLEYLGYLIRRARQPLCPINGVLTLLPFDLIQRSVAEGIEVQRAVKRDLGTLVRVLMIRCPVIALVVGLEEEAGFLELARRLVRHRAGGQRFGKGFSISVPPTPERLTVLAAHACGAFEDWVYNLFREKGALSKTGNHKLYALLCKIRRTFQGRLADVLASGYGQAAEENPEEESLLFGGCYFAAVGDGEDQQAFVKGVFDKLLEYDQRERDNVEEYLEWTAKALAQDDRVQASTQLVLLLDTLLALVLGGLLAWKWLQ